MYKSLVFISFGFISLFLLETKSILASTEFSVYCSSNMDGTGMCNRQDSSQLLECMILQGSIIGCKDKDLNQKFRCIQYGNIIANQAQFSCKVDNLNSLFIPSGQDSDPQEGKSGRSKQKNTYSNTPTINSQPLTDLNTLDGVF